MTVMLADPRLLTGLGRYDGWTRGVYDVAMPPGKSRRANPSVSEIEERVRPFSS